MYCDNRGEQKEKSLEIFKFPFFIFCDYRILILNAFRLYYQNHLILMHELIFQALHQAQFQKINGECLVSKNSVDIQCNGFESLSISKICVSFIIMYYL